MKIKLPILCAILLLGLSLMAAEARSVNASDTASAQSKSPDSGSQLKARGIKCYYELKTPEALECLNEYIEKNNKDTDAYAFRGRLRLFKGDKKGALADFNQMIAIEPSSAMAYSCKTLLDFQNNDFKCAFNEAGKALSLYSNPKTKEDYWLIAQASYYLSASDAKLHGWHTQYMDKSREAYRKVTDLYKEPKNAVEWSRQAQALDAIGDSKAALRCYNTAIAYYSMAGDADLAALYNSRGIIKAEQRDVKGALADYDRAIELNPYQGTQLNRAHLRERTGNFKGAIADYSDELNSKVPYTAADRAYILSDRAILKNITHDTKGAIADCGEGIKLAKTHGLRSAFYCAMRGHLLVGNGRYNEALRDLDSALTDDYIDRWSVLRDRSKARLGLGDWSDAINDLLMAEIIPIQENLHTALADTIARLH